MSASLLVELGTEELPPKALAALAAEFAHGIVEGLAQAGISAGDAHVYATPRRLAVRIADVAGQAPDRHEERLGPAVAAAFDASGQATAAALGFARSCGVTVQELERRDTDKGQRLAYRGSVAGASLAAALPEALANTLRRLPIPRRMRWGDGPHGFVRPVHWLLALHGATVLPLQAFGHAADRYSRGHRFHHPQTVDIGHADDYPDRLETPGRVLVDMQRRRASIQEQVSTAAREAGGTALLHDLLLDEVNALVEWPVALAGRFDPRFLALPREVLVATLEDHQRYFPVVDADGALLPAFVTVANIASRDPSHVVAGNERVLRPRLEDALFFWNRDLQRGLDARVAELSGVAFQRGLGSLADKSQRVTALAATLASGMGADGEALARAAHLAKADLLTEMVGEFPELQGTMGRYYAVQAGEAPTVAQALEEQYWPRHAKDAIPGHTTGRVLALADRLDSLAGLFALGQRPSGEKDPFGLRRAALGVLRIVIEGRVALDLAQALRDAVTAQPVDCDPERLAADLLAFHLDRLRGYYAERGVVPELFAAAAANGLRCPLDFDQRIAALQAFVRNDRAVRLCGAHKRVRNILKNRRAILRVSTDLFTEAAEHDLHAAMASVQADVLGHCDRAEYAPALARIADLADPVDRFFDKVRVMSDDAARQANRLALLAALDGLFRSVADISWLSPAETSA